MPEYRFYTITSGGHIEKPPVEVFFPDDQSAINEARSMLDGQDIEIWEGTRVVLYLVPESYRAEKSG